MISQGTALGPTEAMVEMTEDKSDPHCAAPRSTSGWLVWLAPLISAGLLYLSYFPVACGWLAWFALVPFLCLVRAETRPRRRYLAAWVCGLAFFWPVLSWMRVADPMMYYTWALLATYLAVYFPLVLWLVRILDRRTRLPLMVTFPVAWVAIEYWRYGFFGSFFSILIGSHQHDYPGGFGWYLLGHSQHDFLPLIQIADVTGVYGISFLVAAVNALLFEIVFAWSPFRRLLVGGKEEERADSVSHTRPFSHRSALLIQGSCLALLLLSVLGYGAWRLTQRTQAQGPRVALLQGNLEQRLRSDTTRPAGEARTKARESMKQHFDRLADVAASEHVDLIVWPETSVPGEWWETEPGAPPLANARLANDLRVLCEKSLELAAEMSARYKSWLLVGMNGYEWCKDGKARSYNSAILIDRDGRRRARYDKIHRVPFGEYVPLYNFLPWLQTFAPFDYEYSVSPGRQFTRFVFLGDSPKPQARNDPRNPAKGVRTVEWVSSFGVVICYEDTDPAMALPYAGADRYMATHFIVNISNDGWFHGTSEHDEHLAICRFRAIECRRAVARAVNMGISAVIDSNGRVLAPEWSQKGDVYRWEIPEQPASLSVADWHAYKKVAAVLLATIPIDSRASLYARWGDWFAAGCGGVLLLTLFALPLHRFFRGAS
jgi:apolipoprotein N-acyltransferase